MLVEHVLPDAAGYIRDHEDRLGHLERRVPDPQARWDLIGRDFIIGGPPLTTGTEIPGMRVTLAEYANYFGSGTPDVTQEAWVIAWMFDMLSAGGHTISVDLGTSVAGSDLGSDSGTSGSTDVDPGVQVYDGDHVYPTITATTGAPSGLTLTVVFAVLTTPA